MRSSTPAIRVSPIFVIISLAAFAMLIPDTANGQSGSKQVGSTAKTATSKAVGSSTKGLKAGLEGYCPVCIIDMKKWVKGSSEISSTYDGHTYLFPGQEQKTAFDADPSKYVPALGGDCIVAYKKMGKRTPGNIRQAAFRDNRLFLFSNEMAKTDFIANKDVYENADVALGGKCTVCQIEMQAEVAGKPEFAVLHHGLRYYFPSDKQRDKFIANPSKYAAVKTTDKKLGDKAASGFSQGSSKKQP